MSETCQVEKDDNTYTEGGKQYTMSIKDAVSFTGKSDRTIRRYVSDGKLLHQRVRTDNGEELRFCREDLADVFGITLDNDMTADEVGYADGMTFDYDAQRTAEFKELLTRHEAAVMQLVQVGGSS